MPADLADSVDFTLLDDDRLAKDVRSALEIALEEQVVLSTPGDALSLFRRAVATSIRNIEEHSRGILLQSFLRHGPYERDGPIPQEYVEIRLSDAETAAAISFVWGHMVNSFKGALAEILALAPCTHLWRELIGTGCLPPDTRLYVGEAVSVMVPERAGFAQGADMHLLVERQHATQAVEVVGVIEVKSYPGSRRRLSRQLARHVARVSNGLKLCGQSYPRGHVHVRDCLRIAVTPSSWRLCRTFRFEPSERGRALRITPSRPPIDRDRVLRLAENEWHITLRWSQEALAAAAYAMTFWYMEKVGEVINADGSPEEWSEMTPAAAGRNAVKMMLYYALLRCRSRQEFQRAVALYNTYGFGYALGMNFVDKNGRREMLWPQDLDEIAANGTTACGCRIR